MQRDLAKGDAERYSGEREQSCHGWVQKHNL